MKEWHYLLTVIDSFVYDKNLEEIVFSETEEAKKAKSIYENLIKEYNISDENQRWALDIALDCVRQMSEKDRTYLRESYDVDFFGYGLYIRNNYIHCATRHRGFFSADSQCSVVLGFIYTIMHRYYNCFNFELCELLNNYEYESITEMYNDKFPCIEEETLKLSDPQNTLSAKSVLKTIRKKIRDELGTEGFKKIFLSVVNECGTDILAPQSWLNFINKLYRLCPVYYKEYQQVKALKELGLISDLLSSYNFRGINNVVECKEYIVENIGFTEDDAQLHAETMWEAFKSQKQTEYNEIDNFQI